MTEGESIRVEGFRASLTVRGVECSAGGQPFSALLSEAPPASGEFQIGEAQNVKVSVEYLRGEGPSVNVGEFVTVNGVQARAVEVRDNPARVSVEVICQMP